MRLEHYGCHYEVVTAVLLKVQVFWDVMLCCCRPRRRFQRTVFETSRAARPATQGYNPQGLNLCHKPLFHARFYCIQWIFRTDCNVGAQPPNGTCGRTSCKTTRTNRTHLEVGCVVVAAGNTLRICPLLIERGGTKAARLASSHRQSWPAPTSRRAVTSGWRWRGGGRTGVVPACLPACKLQLHNETRRVMMMICRRDEGLLYRHHGTNWCRHQKNCAFCMSSFCILNILFLFFNKSSQIVKPGMKFEILLRGRLCCGSVFLILTPCTVAVGYRLFGAVYCCHFLEWIVLDINYAFVRLLWVGHLDLMGREEMEQELRQGILLINGSEMYLIRQTLKWAVGKYAGTIEDGWNCPTFVG